MAGLLKACEHTACIIDTAEVEETKFKIFRQQ